MVQYLGILIVIFVLFCPVVQPSTSTFMKAIVIVAQVLLFLVVFSPLSGQEIPSSIRSERAIESVKPQLENDLSIAGLQWGQPVFIRIFKKERILQVWVKSLDADGYVLFRAYKICSIGSGLPGPKFREGDGRVPEGFYFFRPVQLHPTSQFHLAFNIGYPNEYDRHHRRTGSAIMVHGDCVSIGCFAMTDAKIEEIYALVDAAFRGGQSFIRIHIFPFELTDANLRRQRYSRWHSFWLNLKEGYDYFEQNGFVPPNTRVRDGVYVFN